MSKLAKLAFFGLVIGFFGIVITLIISGETFSDAFIGDYEEYHFDEHYDMGEIEIIDIRASGSKINVIPSSDHQIRVKYEGRVNELLNFSTNLEVKSEEDEMLIQLKKKSPVSFLTFLQDNELTVYIPRKNFEGLHITAAAGRVIVDDVHANEVYIESNAGKVILNDLISNNIFIDVSAGNVELNRVAGNIEADVNAGRMEGYLEEIVSDITLEANAGSIDLTIKELPQDLKVDIQVNGGRIHTDLPIESQSTNEMKGIIGSGKDLLLVRISAGSFHLNVD